ncbi:MAG: hypothetical protein ABR583_04485 [Gaiellaceae bacterium]
MRSDLRSPQPAHARHDADVWRQLPSLQRSARRARAARPRTPMTPDEGADRKAEQRFEQLAYHFLADPTVTRGTVGSTPGLRTRSKIFAMLARGELVVKLPKARVDQLVEAGIGRRFDPGHGRLMKEWATVDFAAVDDWEALADEALQFVGSAAAR